MSIYASEIPSLDPVVPNNDPQLIDDSAPKTEEIIDPITGDDINIEDEEEEDDLVDDDEDDDGDEDDDDDDEVLEEESDSEDEKDSSD